MVKKAAVTKEYTHVTHPFPGSNNITTVNSIPKRYMMLSGKCSIFGGKTG